MVLDTENTINNTDIPSHEVLSLLLKAEAHRGEKKASKRIAPYVFKKSSDGESNIFNLNKTWQKIRAAARLLVTVEDKSNICLVASTAWAKRSIFKFSQYSGAHSISGRFIPGTFTNQICSSFLEPSVLISCDPKLDSQAITEASYVNVPVIALCDSDTSVENVDVVIPCSNKNRFSVAAVFYLLCRELLRMSGELKYDETWAVKVDLFILKDLAVLKKRMDADNETRARLEEAERIEKEEKERKDKLDAENNELKASEDQKPPAEEAVEREVVKDAVEPTSAAGIPETPLHPHVPQMPAFFNQQAEQFNRMPNINYMNYPMNMMGFGAVGSDSRLAPGQALPKQVAPGYRQNMQPVPPDNKGKERAYDPSMQQGDYMGAQRKGVQQQERMQNPQYNMPVFNPYNMPNPMMQDQYNEFVRFQMSRQGKSGSNLMPQDQNRQMNPGYQGMPPNYMPQQQLQPNFNPEQIHQVHPQQRGQPGAPRNQHGSGPDRRGN